MDSATNANDNGKRARMGKTPPPHQKQQQSTAVQMARLAASVTIASLPYAIKALASTYHQQFLQLRIDLRVERRVHTELFLTNLTFKRSCSLLPMANPNPTLNRMLEEIKCFMRRLACGPLLGKFQLQDPAGTGQLVPSSGSHIH
jgi:hypothetical protein